MSIIVIPQKQTLTALINNDLSVRTITILNAKEHNDVLEKEKDKLEVEKQYIKHLIKEFTSTVSSDVSTQYDRYSIPKRHGGYRQIVSPKPELKYIQEKIVDYLENGLKLYSHDCAMAYVKHRDILTNAKEHKNMKMVLTLDIHDFFGSISEETVITQLLKLYNVQKLLTKEELTYILKPCFLDGVLPQGSPTSPFISNLIMIEFDEHLKQYCNSLGLKYTRYADDMFISGDLIEKPKAIQITVQKMLNEISPDLKLNTEKTKILRPGACYICGIKINKNNNLTYGHKQKTVLKHELYNLFIGEQNKTLTVEEVMEVLGRFNFAHRIEPEYFNYIEQKLLRKFNVKEKTFVEHFKYIYNK